MSDPRYASGTSLDRTEKESVLDGLAELIELEDEEYVALKRLTTKVVRSLRKAVIQAVSDAEVRGVRFGRGEDLTKGAGKAKKAEPKPIDVVLFCPNCSHQHFDEPDPEKGWTNPPHKSHLCHHCGTIWRAADVPTNGVGRAKTQGEKDTYPC